MKPDDVFARDLEWSELERHVVTGRGRLGIVTGRRRVGKTYLLRRLAEQHHGMYVSCLQEERLPALQRFASQLGSHHGTRLGVPPDWQVALEQATSGPLAVPLLVIDEFPYWLQHSPEVESVIQHIVDQSRDASGTRVILCGSSLSIMGGLLDGTRPLRGRADLQMRLSPFDYRSAARFWGVEDPSVAFRVHAILGGSPGYRALVSEFPTQLNELDQWVTDTVLNPASALYREDSYVLAEDHRVADKAIYGSVLRVIADGERRPSRIGGRLGRQQTSLSHVFAVLDSAGFLVNEAGLLSGRDPHYRVIDEVVRFLRSCADPWRQLIEDGRRAEAWAAAQPSWQAQILGPHLEQLARDWAAQFAGPDVLGGAHGIIGRAELADSAGRISREVDLVVLRPGSRPGGDAQVQVIGEVKLRADDDALVHLDRCTELLERRGHGRPTQLLIVAEEHSNTLRDLARHRPDVRLVDLAEMFAG